MKNNIKYILNKIEENIEKHSSKEKNISRNYLKQFKGIIFTGGNSLISCNGDSKERDKAEKKNLYFSDQYANSFNWCVSRYATYSRNALY